MTFTVTINHDSGSNINISNTSTSASDISSASISTKDSTQNAVDAPGNAAVGARPNASTASNGHNTGFAGGPTCYSCSTCGTSHLTYHHICVNEACGADLP